MNILFLLSEISVNLILTLEIFILNNNNKKHAVKSELYFIFQLFHLFGRLIRKCWFVNEENLFALKTVDSQEHGII